MPVLEENTRIRTEMKRDVLNARLDQLADYAVYQILEYVKYQFEVVGIIGANRSPSCGVDTTSNNNSEVEGRGLFMEKIFYRLSEKNIFIPMIGLKGTDNISDKLRSLLKNM